MTVLTSQHEILGTGRVVLPRVNLLPPEIAAKAAFRRIQMGMGAAVLASVAVVGGLYVSASHSVSAAQSDLDAARSQQTKLQQQVSSYAGVSAIYAAADAAQAQMSNAMADEVRYSQLMYDLSLAVPSNVWLNNLSVAPANPAATAVAGAPAPTALATVSFGGVAYSHSDVAAWLEALGKLSTYANPYFTSSTEVPLGSRTVVNFSSTADLTPKALSHRYTKPAGG